jgi:hypothetical protein
MYAIGIVEGEREREGENAKKHHKRIGYLLTFV